MTMQGKHLNTLLTFKRAATFGIGFGITLFLFSLFASGYNKGYFLSILGIGIIVACMVNFGFGMFLSLIDEYTVNSKGKVHPSAFKKSNNLVYKDFNQYDPPVKKKYVNVK